jgi:hypothetical protein
LETFPDSDVNKCILKDIIKLWVIIIFKN